MSEHNDFLLMPCPPTDNADSARDGKGSGDGTVPELDTHFGVPIPDGPDRMIEPTCLLRHEWLQTEASIRQEAEDILRKAEALRRVRQLLDPVWAAHPEWTFEEVCAQALIAHPGLGKEASP